MTISSNITQERARYELEIGDGPRGLRYGIVGAGMMGREHMCNLAFLPGAAVVAVADPFPGSQQAAIAVAASITPHAPSLQVFSNHKELLDRGICDVLVVASPNMTHAAILLDVLRHPRPHHILVEKPLCTTVEDCQRVLAAAEARKDILLQVGLEYRYMPPVARLIEEVKAGTVGPVRMVAIREHRFPFLVKVNNWNRFNRNSGGTLVEKCCHFFDLMNLITGATPARVMASGAQSVNHLDESYDGEVPDILDNAFVIIEYDNGSRATLDLCMFAEGSRNEQEISVVGDLGKGEALVPEGVVRLGLRSGGREGVKTFQVHDDRVKWEGLHHGSSYLEHMEFMASVKSHGQRPPAVTLQEGLLSVAVGVAAQRSIELGRIVSLEEVLDAEAISGLALQA